MERPLGTCAPNEIAEAVLEHFYPFAAQRGLELGCVVALDVPHVLNGNPEHLRQALFHLVDNAVKFTQSGGVVVEIRKEKEEGSEILLKILIHDTGSGLQGEMRKKITLPGDQISGTGIGLRSARKAVASLGGALGVEDSAGPGTSLWFTAKFEKGAARSAAPKPPRPGSRVLIVSANPVLRKVLRQSLELLQVSADEASEWMDCLPILGRQQGKGGCGMIFLDACPELDEAVQSLRNAAASPHLPIVSLEAVLPAGSAVRRKAAEAGLHYVKKPLRRAALLECLASCLPAAGAAAAPAAEAGESRGAEQSDSAKAQNWRFPVLIVSKDQELWARLMIIFRKLGYPVDSVSDAADALNHRSKMPYGLILVDDPEIKIAAELRKLDGQGRTPIVALIHQGREVEASKTVGTEIDTFLGKPVDAAALETLLRQWDVPVDAWSASMLRKKSPTVIKGFFKQAPELMASLRRAAEGKEGAALDDAEDSLRRWCMEVGARALAALASRVKPARVTGIPPLPELWSAIDEEYKRLRPVLEQITDVKPEAEKAPARAIPRPVLAPPPMQLPALSPAAVQTPPPAPAHVAAAAPAQAPAAAAGQPAAAHAAGASSPKEGPAKSGLRKAVVCDDDWPMADLVRHILVKEGFSVATADNGQDGLALIAREKPNLVVLDLNMPIKSGAGVLKELKDAGRGTTHPGPYVIILSNHETKDRQVQLRELGADEIMLKPLTPGDLKAKIAALVQAGRI